jgi:hypothetical protein
MPLTEEARIVIGSLTEEGRIVISSLLDEEGRIVFVEAAAPEGQPVQIRTQGIPTGSGRRDRPGGWN